MRGSIVTPAFGFRAGLTILCLAAGFFGFGCGSNPSDPGNGGPNPGVLQIVTTGRLERSAQVELQVLRGQAPVPPGQLTWSVQPGGAAAFEAGQRARLLQAGSVTLAVKAGADSGQVVLNVAAPPAVVFDLLRNGRRNIYRVAIDGKDFTQLTSDPADESAPTAAAGRAVFSRLLFIEETQQFNGELYSVGLAGGAVTRLTNTAATERDPALSRDGQRLAYLRLQGGVPKLWTASGTGTGAARATANFGFDGAPEASPSWAPSGDRLVFVAVIHGNADLFVLDVQNGTIQEFLVDGTPKVEPSWSPDGNWIAFTSEREGQVDIFRVHVTTGAIEQLTDRPEPDYQPAYLADGRLAFLAEVGGVRRIRWLDPENPEIHHTTEIGDGLPDGLAGVH